MTDLQYTPIEDIENVSSPLLASKLSNIRHSQIYDELKAGFASGKSRAIAYRKYQLAQLMYLLSDNLTRWDNALNLDLGRPLLECRL